MHYLFTYTSSQPAKVGGKWNDQNKHIEGKSYIPGRSILTSDPLELLDGICSGDFDLMRHISNSKTVVDFGKNIGIFYNNGIRVGPTNYGIVITWKKGVHIYPVNPNQY